MNLTSNGQRCERSAWIRLEGAWPGDNVDRPLTRMPVRLYNLPPIRGPEDVHGVRVNRNGCDRPGCGLDGRNSLLLPHIGVLGLPKGLINHVIRANIEEVDPVRGP